MKKEDLKTGMFGMMSDGKWFVIVNDLIVYEKGSFDKLRQLNENLSYGVYDIDILVNALSFDCAKCNAEDKNNILYDRYAEKETVMTIAEIEEKLGIKNLVIKGE